MSCVTDMSLSFRAVPATSPTDEMHNACTSSFRAKQWNGSSARPNMQTVTHSVQHFESRLATAQQGVRSVSALASSRHDSEYQDQAIHGGNATDSACSHFQDSSLVQEPGLA